jgi:hypothetical protein
MKEKERGETEKESEKRNKEKDKLLSVLFLIEYPRYFGSSIFLSFR